MKSSGELEYSIVNWDTNLLTPTGLQSAGPLFSIDCTQESVRELGLPHCQILSEGECESLLVAHVTEGDLEVLQPLGVTDTHVTVTVTGLSLFGLLKKWLSIPVKSQVLFFLWPLDGDDEQRRLSILLLPRNIPIDQVKAQKRPQTNIETISNCHLTPGKMYSMSCSLDRGHQIQPMSACFDDDYGPNYHPTFEMFLDLDVKKMNLRRLEKNIEEKQVWTSLVILKGAATKHCSVVPPAAQFVDKHWAELVQRVTTVEPVADNLLSQGQITREEYNKIRVAQTSQQKMRLIYDFLDCGGDSAKSAFYTILRKEAPHLVQDLEAKGSRSGSRSDDQPSSTSSHSNN
ncbi:hypothetical protein AGOR_G00222340 [Albula goreensis]|uniref:CARD domain-containing protein n=1 Tax=Albula goreensis TaxID=1534307 RepID=A0A8T3CHL3_9TELE|nr:hypothetical protein AGOR_G00222340 [Albula goreensis]